MVTRAANLTRGEGARPDLIFELLQVLAVCLHGTSESSEGDAQSSRATPLKGDSRRYLSEDFAFCRRWRDMGGKVGIDHAVEEQPVQMRLRVRFRPIGDVIELRVALH